MLAEHAEARRGMITGTRMPMICGLSPYGGPLQAYLEALGRFDRLDNEPMRWGRLLQGVVIEAFSESSGIPARSVEGTFVKHPHHAWAGASPDAVTASGEPVDAKTTRSAEGWGPIGSDEVPDHIAVQVHWQMECMNKDRAFVACLIGGQDLRWYQFERRQDIVEGLVRIGADFARRLASLVPPPVDWQDPRSPALVELLQRPVDGVAALMFEPEYGRLATFYEETGQQLRTLEKDRAMAKARLVNAMGEASMGQLPDGRVIVRKIIKAGRVEAYDRAEYCSFRIKGAKQERVVRPLPSPEEIALAQAAWDELHADQPSKQPDDR
jgi:putative phage-type endonuclease